MKRLYRPPTIISESSFATSALACGKTTTPPPGSHHFYSAYDTFTGHGEMGMGAWSVTGQFGVGWGPGGSSLSYSYAGLCLNFVSLST